ncbi:DNA-protecting protein DprA [Candidatus Peregrinibacteria bacterium]|nr:DNA-protecting protein DprA [Candidatus Peregrinibacteria bacterium]
MQNEAKFIHGLWLLPEMNHRKLSNLLEAFGTFEQAWKRYGDQRNLDKEMEWLWNNDIFLIDRSSKEYPMLLMQIPYPPWMLYRKGSSLLCLEKMLAIVGTRKATENGLELAHDWSKSFADAGGTVVSGLAFGVDAAAHRGAIKSTIAVLPGGLMSIAPRSHIGLAKQILANGGALISEYPPEKDCRKHHFLERNRIISGLCKATLVIEASEKSGALMTAHYALEQNREVWAVPGNPGKIQSKGCNSLIKVGAGLIDQGEDLLELYGLKGKIFELKQNQQSIMREIEKYPHSIEELMEKLDQNIVYELPTLETLGLIRLNNQFKYEKVI